MAQKQISLELGSRYKITYPDGTEKKFKVIGGEPCKVEFDNGECVEITKLGMYTSIDKIEED